MFTKDINPLNSFLNDPEAVIKKIVKECVEEAFANISLNKINSSELTETIYNRKEAATFLKISLTQLYYLQKRKSIPYYRLGKKVYFKQADLINSLSNPIEKGGQNAN